MLIRSKILSSISLAICFFLFGNSLSAQTDYSLKTFTASEGLSNNWVQSICQDSTGFLWVATWDGLSRFDGYEFKNYDCIPEDSLSLPYFSLDKVAVDRFGNVLVMCVSKPLSVYNSALDHFEKFKVNGRIIRVDDIRIDDHNNTWLVGPDSLFVSKGANRTFDKIAVVDIENKPFTLRHTKYLAIDNTGTVWLYMMNTTGISIWKGSEIGDSVIRMEAVNELSLKGYKSYELHNSDVLDFYQSKSGNLWMFSKYGLFVYNRFKNAFIPNKSRILPDEFTGKPYFKWIDETTGINVIDTQLNSYFTIKADPEKYFETVFIDKHKILWSGNISKSKDNIGLGKYNRIPKYFKQFLTEKNEKKESYQICSVLKDRFGNIWAGLRNQDYLIRIKPNGEINKLKFYDQHENGILAEPQSMVQDSSGIWIGLSNSQLIYYNYKENKFIRQFSTPLIFNDKPYGLAIHNILKNKNQIIINGSEGIYSYNLTTHKLNLEYKFYSSGIGFTMNSDGENGIWVGLNSAVIFHLNSSFQKDESFRIREREDIIEQVCPGDNNDLWLALQGGGLGHLFRKDGAVEIFTTKDGLVNNTIHSILKDSGGNLWLSSDKGISEFNVKTNKFRNYEIEDGVKIQEFNDDSNFKSSDGEIFLGGVGGIVSFYPDKIKDEENERWPLIITDLTVSGSTRRFKKATYEMDTLMLQKGDNNFHISFASLNFKDYLKIKYRYRFTRVSDKWRTTDQKNRGIAYYNLLPGTYKLEIEASGKSGKWDSKTSVSIIIPFRIYETIWFKILLGLLVLFALAGFIVLYIKGIQIRAKREQEELRMQVLRSQMNPHFIFNSLNSINYFISKNDKMSANKYIADFSRLIRSFLSNLSNDFVPVETEFQLLSDYLNLEHLRFGDKFTYNFDTSRIVDFTDLYILSGIVQPFIENAIWHGMNGLEGRKGQLNIYFQFVNPTLMQCIIEDDGVGRKLAAKYRPTLGRKKLHGIGIVLERLQFYNIHKNGNYQVSITDKYLDRLETGTIVTIDLPFRRWKPGVKNIKY